MDAFCFYQEVLYRQARYCLDFQRAYETEQKRLADEERRREKKRSVTRESMRKLRKRRREEKEKRNSLQSDCSSHEASDADGAPVGSSKKRKVSGGSSPAAALITPHKPQEDVPEIEHAESNDDHYDDSVDDDDMHCFDDDDHADVRVEDRERTLGVPPGQSYDANVEEDEKLDSKPAASTPATAAKVSDDQGSEGKVGLVLIPLKATNEQIASFVTGTKYMYWPAIIYSSYDSFESSFPLVPDTRQLYAAVNRERMLHETHEIATWAQHGIIPLGNDAKPVQVAILFGSDVPPCGTRSFPIYPRDIAIIRGGVPQMPQVPFSKTKGLKDMLSDYAKNPKFQDAIQLAERYKATKDAQIFASLKLR